MLILVAVTVTVLVDSDIIGQAEKSKELYQNAYANEGEKVSDEKINGGNHTTIDEYLEKNGHEIKMLEGDEQSYYTSAPTALSFRSSANINDFQEVQVNGETIDPSNYTITEGSIIVSLSIEYLKTLEEDDYSISIVSKTGSPSARFSVIKPDVNGHGFYYNQPYTAYLPNFGGNTAFFVRENGTYDIITVGKNPDTDEYIVSGNNITATHPLLGTITCTISPDGTEIYCNELATNFVLGDEAFAADEDYFYTYDSSLDGYVASSIDRTKASYSPIRTGINGYPTVKLADNAFNNCYYMNSVPTIPDSVTTIGSYTFSNCSRITSITIPKSVNSIEKLAFSYCSSLTDIYYAGTTTEWNQISFGDSWCNSVNNGNNFTVHCSDGDVVI